MKLSDYVMEFLADEGVGHLFMLPGGGAMHLNDSAGQCARLEYVCTLHEQASAVAAEAYARTSGNLGAALVTTGPGGTNAVTGVSAAWLDSTPCVFISGQVKRPDIAAGTPLRQLGVQEIDIVSIVRPITKYAVTVLDPDEIRFQLEKALHVARNGRPGPVWIDIPLDVQPAEIDPSALTGYVPEVESSVDARQHWAQQVEAALAHLVAAERPIVLVGNGVRIAGAEREFLDLVDALHVPVLTTRLGVDLIPADHPLLVGMPGGIASRGANFALQNCDCLLVLGARLDMALIAYAPERLARAASKIMVNIDADEIAKLGDMVDLPIAMDAAGFIGEMLQRVQDAPLAPRAPWLERCKQWKARYPFVLPEHRDASRGLSMYAFSEALSDALSGDDVVLPGSSGFACEIFLTAFAVKAGQRVFHNKGTGAMGLAQPAALGACLGAGGRRTICVDGDGGFQMNIQELETIRRLDLPIKFFVIDNGGYASIRSSQSNYFGRLTGADPSSGMTLPDVLRIAQAYGVATVDIADPASLHGGIREVLEQAGPVVCRVKTIADEARMPRVSSMQKPDGRMVSKPLEDMWPFLPREEFFENMIVPPLPEE